MRKSERWLVVGIVLLMFSGCSITGDKQSSKLGKSSGLPIETVEPPYPVEAFEKCTGGEVQFEFSLSEDGTPVGIEITSSQPERLFDDAAYAGFRRWKFEVPSNYRPWQKYRMPLIFPEPEGCQDTTVQDWTPDDDWVPPEFCQDGRITLSFIIDEEGHVKDLRILSSSMPVALDMALMKYVRSITFEPRIVDGKRASRRARLSFDFSEKNMKCARTHSRPE